MVRLLRIVTPTRVMLQDAQPLKDTAGTEKMASTGKLKIDPPGSETGMFCPAPLSKIQKLSIPKEVCLFKNMTHPDVKDGSCCELRFKGLLRLKSPALPLTSFGYSFRSAGLLVIAGVNKPEGVFTDFADMQTTDVIF